MSRQQEAGKRMQEVVCVAMSLCPVLSGIVGRCSDAEHQPNSCQQPYVMKLYPCHSERGKGTAAHWLHSVKDKQETISGGHE